MARRRVRLRQVGDRDQQPQHPERRPGVPPPAAVPVGAERHPVAGHARDVHRYARLVSVRMNFIMRNEPITIQTASVSRSSPTMPEPEPCSNAVCS